ncbi:MAG: ABC transporter permease [Candidatus Saccharibacteria bacterium]|nr:ABC transporter permease [Candidatus Saccharibacteria bacterium]
MRKPLFIVTKFEIIRQLKKPSFWLSVLLIPAFFGLIAAISYFGSKDIDDMASDTSGEDTRIAIVDEAGVLPKENPFMLYETKDEGIEAVKNDEIDLFYYIPADFAEAKKVEFYQVSEGLHLFDSSAETIKGILSSFVASTLPEKDTLAITGGYEIETMRLSVDGEDANILGRAIVPGIALVAFFLFLTLGGNRLTMTVVEEKENRISEMILTSVSPRTLIIGKMIAMIVLGFIQLLAVLIPIAVLIFLNRENPMVSSVLSMIELNPPMIIASVLLFFFSILLLAGALTFIGAFTPNAKDASNFMAPVILGTVFPFYFMSVFLAGEVTFVLEFLTFFPLSAPMSLMLRNTLGTLSVPELIIGLIEIASISILMIYLTMKTFQKNAINFEVALPKFLKKKNK